jgi:hypothetical protein
MKILGIRNYSDGLRYCILEKDANGTVCLNLNSENRILIPKGYDDNQLLVWYQDEIDRILDMNSDIERVAIKHNENTRSDSYSTLKRVMFMDCIATLEVTRKSIPVNSYVYNQICVNSKNVLEKAESLVGKSLKYWDSKFADAIMVANKEIENGI